MKRTRFPLRRDLALAALGLAFLASCRAAAPEPEGPPLPFHVGLIPAEIHDTSVLAGASNEPVWAEASAEADLEDMRLELATDEVTRILADELDRAFVRTTVLALPDDPRGLAGLSQRDRDQYWQEQARLAGADLLVRTRLLFDPQIEGERNEKFWLNLPLFLLGGPMCYFVGDRRYEVTARLQAEVFDASLGHETLDDFALLTIPLYAEAQPTDLRFLDRADGAGDYALSLLVPAGLLARETDEVERELQSRLPEELGRELAAEVLTQRAQFESNLALGSFRLAAEDAQVESMAANRVRLRVPVEELGREGALLRYELRSEDDAVLLRRDFAGVAEAGILFIEDEVPLGSDEEFLTVRVVDANANARSYTLRVRPKPKE